jgi:hypothetical protein
MRRAVLDALSKAALDRGLIGGTLASQRFGNIAVLISGRKTPLNGEASTRLTGLSVVLSCALQKPPDCQGRSRLNHHILQICAPVLAVALHHKIKQVPLVSVRGIKARRGNPHDLSELRYRSAFISRPSEQVDSTFERRVGIEGPDLSPRHI